MQYACAILSSVACPALHNFSTLFHKRYDFRKNYWIKNACFNFLYNFCLKHFSFQDELSKMWSKIFICLHIKCPLFLAGFNETGLPRQFFEKYSYINFYENPFGGSRVFPSVQTDRRTDRQTDRWTDMPKLIDAFRNFASAPNDECHTWKRTCVSSRNIITTL